MIFQLTEEKKQEKIEIINKDSKVRPSFYYQKIDKYAHKYRDVFYKNNTTNFFKTGNYCFFYLSHYLDAELMNLGKKIIPLFVN